MQSKTRQPKIFDRFLIASVIILLGQSASAAVISNHGGPLLGGAGNPYTIYPYYYGSAWGGTTSPAVVAEQEFLTNLAAFISGKNLPPGVTTFLHQYGVVSTATVAAPAVNLTPTATAMSNQDILNAIGAAQTAGTLPHYAANVLILMMPASGFSPCTSCDSVVWWSYHRAAGTNEYYAATFADATGCQAGTPTYQCFSLASSHEIIEATTDPGFSVSYAWDNFGPPNIELCDNAPDQGFSYMGSKFPGCYDNSLSGAPTTTGYTPPTAFEPDSFIIPVMIPMYW